MRSTNRNSQLETRPPLTGGACTKDHERVSNLRSESGQSLVEVALVMPLLLALLLGVIELGRYTYIG
jgi:Flp pilus assembly protein TadG